MRTRNHIHEQLLFKSCRYQLDRIETDELARANNGFNGELQFDQSILSVVEKKNLIQVKDFLFAYDGGKECQIDNIIFANDAAHIFEVKNYSFDIIVDLNGKWLFESKQEISPLPLEQAKYQRNMLLKLFQYLNIPLEVRIHTVFMNPSQMIYGLSQSNEVLMGFQLAKKIPQILGANNYDFSQLVDILEQERKPRSKYYKPLDVDISSMRKGIVCRHCYQFLIRVSAHIYFCRGCQQKMKQEIAIENLIYEMSILDDRRTFTSKELATISGDMLKSSTIRRHRHKSKQLLTN